MYKKECENIFKVLLKQGAWVYTNNRLYGNICVKTFIISIKQLVERSRGEKINKVDNNFY